MPDPIASPFRTRRPGGPRRRRALAAGVAAAAVGIAGCGSAQPSVPAATPTTLGHPASPAASRSSSASTSATGSKGSTSTTTAPAPPLAVTSVSPAPGVTGAVGTTAIVVDTNQPVGASRPTVTPAVPGRWSASADSLRFTPTSAWPPDTTVHVTVPAGLRSAAGPALAAARSWSFTTGAGSVRRLQELLAVLRYLPLSWRPTTAGTRTGSATTAAADAAVYRAPAGRFTWRWTSAPTTLHSTWKAGTSTVMTKGAVMAFESDHGLAIDGVPGPAVWGALLKATAPDTALATDQHGYTYALTSKALPEQLTVWHDGRVISTTAANTGIPSAPTVDGTFPVYERLATQTMKGNNPDGSRYADPVAWVAYFNGGDAIHYIGRSSYGSPQSLGCVEIPYAVGAHIWPQLTYGTLVSVVG